MALGNLGELCYYLYEAEESKTYFLRGLKLLDENLFNEECPEIFEEIKGLDLKYDSLASIVFEALKIRKRKIDEHFPEIVIINNLISIYKENPQFIINMLIKDYNKIKLEI